MIFLRGCVHTEKLLATPDFLEWIPGTTPAEEKLNCFYPAGPRRCNENWFFFLSNAEISRNRKAIRANNVSRLAFSQMNRFHLVSFDFQ